MYLKINEAEYFCGNLSNSLSHYFPFSSFPGPLLSIFFNIIKIKNDKKIYTLGVCFMVYNNININRALLHKKKENRATKRQSLKNMILIIFPSVF